MQTLANVMNIPIAVVTSEQACALGAAMFAATIAGIYPSAAHAQKAMSSGFDITYYPQEEKVLIYQNLYKQYRQLGAVFLACHNNEHKNT
jgi:L-ribulokinase